MSDVTGSDRARRAFFNRLCTYHAFRGPHIAREIAVPGGRVRWVAMLTGVVLDLAMILG